MGKVKRGGYIFVFRLGDHAPKHVHIFKEGREVAKWNLEASVLMKGKMNARLRRIIESLLKEGVL